ncbi:MAG: FAD-dependent oxidoreductase [Chloroflexi bacterium]|nr:FAD-dependent oxidoreductase [Chloroflexota bacterium]
MADYDVVIIGGGPAGLTAGLYLARGKHRTILLEKESLGGYIKNVDWIENYPGFSEGVSGARLATEMVSQAARYGLKLELAEVVGIELFSSTKWVECADGRGYTAKAIIVAAGSKHKELGVPGEKALRGRGVINCALCDGGQFAEKVVAVCGGGDTGVTEALYMSKLASKVVLIASRLKASAILRDRALSNPKLEIHSGCRAVAIIGNGQVEGIELVEVESGRKETVKVDGVLVCAGLTPNTSFLRGIVPFDDQGQIVVGASMATEVPGIYAAGDVRCDSPRQVSAAVGDGTMAAVSAERFLMEQEVS